MQIHYRLNGPCTAQEVVECFARSGIRRPIEDQDRIQRMLEHADVIITARHDGSLVGLLRAITDYSYCCYVSDIAVDQSYQGQGIGRALVRRLTDELGEDEIQYVLTSAPQAVGFYEAIGFERADKAFVKRRRIN